MTPPIAPIRYFRLRQRCAGLQTLVCELTIERDDAIEKRDEAIAGAALPCLPRNEPEPTLTPRERELLTLLAQGRESKEICAAMGVSLNTVKTCMHKAFKRIGARNRAHAVAIALSCGWISLN